MIFHHFSQNESVISKMDSCNSYRNKRNAHMSYDCRDIGGFLEVAFVWIHPPPAKSVQNTMATCAQQYRF